MHTCAATQAPTDSHTSSTACLCCNAKSSSVPIMSQCPWPHRNQPSSPKSKSKCDTPPRHNPHKRTRTRHNAFGRIATTIFVYHHDSIVLVMSRPATPNVPSWARWLVSQRDRGPHSCTPHVHHKFNSRFCPFFSRWMQNEGSRQLKPLGQPIFKDELEL